VITLITAQGLPIWSLEILIGFAGICFSLSAHCFGLIRLPLSGGISRRTVVLVLIIWSGISFFGYFIWPKERFVIYYCDSELDRKQITLATYAGPTRCGMFVDTNISAFSTSGIIARNEGSAALQVDAAYLSFSAPVSKWQPNSGS
jgi:hypothetical protein